MPGNVLSTNSQGAAMYVSVACQRLRIIKIAVADNEFECVKVKQRSFCKANGIFAGAFLRYTCAGWTIMLTGGQLRTRNGLKIGSAIGNPNGTPSSSSRISRGPPPCYARTTRSTTRGLSGLFYDTKDSSWRPTSCTPSHGTATSCTSGCRASAWQKMSSSHLIRTIPILSNHH